MVCVVEVPVVNHAVYIDYRRVNHFDILFGLGVFQGDFLEDFLLDLLTGNHLGNLRCYC